MDVTIERLRPSEADECERILRALPQWFGIEEAIREFRRDVAAEEAFIARAGGNAVGFLSIRPLNPLRASIHVLAVLPEHHRRGIGRALLARAEAVLVARGVIELEAKTLGPSCPDPFYARTRAFYAAMGFEPVQQTTSIWGQANPCLILHKRLI